MQQFGSNLIHRTQFKQRSNLALKGFLLVDSPGMIDSNIKKDVEMDRGYDFEGVCRWYAERADVILLFFDPDKPGTTGETLSILTNSLAGVEHKLHIILNKADQFANIHDFARSYGCLCWNLSKVIDRKDLPKIHTICLPATSLAADHLRPSSYIVSTPERESPMTTQSSVSITPTTVPTTVPVSGIGQETRDIKIDSPFMRKFFDLETSRVEVEKEVFNAPNRRVDHEISRLNINIHTLRMYCKIVDKIVTSHRQYSMNWGVSLTLTVTTYLGFLYHNSTRLLRLIRPPPLASVTNAKLTPPSTVSIKWNSPNTYLIGSTVIGALAVYGLYLWQDYCIRDHLNDLLSLPHVESIYNTLYTNEITLKNEYISDLWKRLSTHFQYILRSSNFKALHRVRKEDLHTLDGLISKDIHQLRKQAVGVILQQTQEDSQVLTLTSDSAGSSVDTTVRGI